MDATVRDRALFIDETLVIADLHLGRGESSSVDLPLGDSEDVRERLAEVLGYFEPETVVLAGDILHAFDTLPRGIDEHVDAVARTVSDCGATVVAVEGNHDTMLGEVWDGETVDHYWLDEETVVVHGHEEPSVDAQRYVIGHEHPTIEIEGTRRPCFLHGPGGPDGTTVVVLPAFTRLAPGVAINGMYASDFDSPLVVDADALAPVVRDDAAGETLEFPPLGAFRHRL